MTAIVETINRRGVVFAVDSITTQYYFIKTEITNHANKIFVSE